ncbi:phospholipase A(1) DAD1, chloroplastic-like [Cucurbita moschata]|uniref:Phospholipase A(1) DAD1, chloroplastic-like n=1 Tax=Cucurbita moschata TaxID=3662 RepID=A0A6J1H7B0_CUCMO|nr:phospholipase A(1) DAD1, chloroplastic-like [Cucurbita moschata]
MRTSISISLDFVCPHLPVRSTKTKCRVKAMHSTTNNVGRKWTEYQGIQNWDGLLDPLDDHLRKEILRYGRFIEAAYNSFEFDITSPFYATSRHSKSSLLNQSGLSETGYRLTKYLRATTSIGLPHWVEKAANSIATRSSWIGYVAVCEDKKEISRLGRRDIVIAYRGTATCLEWLENLRATLTELPNNEFSTNRVLSRPMVETGFLSLYSSKIARLPSLKQTIREEVRRLLKAYDGEPLSITITGHSLGAAVATLTAYDINVTFRQQVPLVTVVSFGGPRVGNKDFQRSLEEQGTKVLRIVNSGDVVTKVPGFVADDGMEALPWWARQCMENVPSQWLYSEVGKELKLSNKNSSNVLGIINMGTNHDLKTYLRLVQRFKSSKSTL